jgi:hypothetical protein
MINWKDTYKVKIRTAMTKQRITNCSVLLYQNENDNMDIFVKILLQKNRFLFFERDKSTHAVLFCQWQEAICKSRMENLITQSQNIRQKLFCDVPHLWLPEVADPNMIDYG